MKPNLTPPIRTSVAVHFRGRIEEADSSGLSREKMVLRMTLADASALKRDRGIAISDIGFADGVMRFLGVRVEEGGVARSELGVYDASAKPPAEPAARKKPARKSPAKPATAKRAAAATKATPQPPVGSQSL
jgi:hypothetical protein